MEWEINGTKEDDEHLGAAVLTAGDVR